MVRARLLAALGCLLTAHVSAAPINDLASSSQEVRDRAAALLRASFVAPPRSRWEPIVAAINPSDTNEAIKQLLQPYGVTPESGISINQSFSESYRLDDVWVLSCTFRKWESGGLLLRQALIEQPRDVWIAPPADFTGTWTTYFVNGQRSREVQYRNGQYFGTFTAFNYDGSKAFVQHYGAEGIDGDTGYFPSGAVSYRGRYSKGEPTGTWVWFNEDGSVRSTQENPP